jgi:16S rRNA (guanine527-N7)-methyltransferase
VTDWQQVASQRYPDASSGLNHYTLLLSTLGIERGLIGPREVPRLWDRHILNCAVAADSSHGLIRADASVIDIGTGAGLPGLVWAITRTDITVTLVDSMLRRVEFLEQAVTELGLTDRVTVVRGRAEDLAGSIYGDVVTARAVAPLPKLLTWLEPFVSPGGSILAFKGQNAAEEIAEAGPELNKLGAGSTQVHMCGDWLDQPTVIVEVKNITGQGGSRRAGHRRR